MNVLFVCNGNVARSQEAELFFNTLKHDENSFATSGGINVKLGKPIDPLVIEAMIEIGYDITEATRKFTTEDMANAADLVVSFKPADELPDFLRNHANIQYWNVDDPQAQPIEFHRQIRDEIKIKVEKLIVERKL
jgi:arsenate reductase (thioredoxin)